MTVIRYSDWDPFRELLALQSELERVFDHPFGFDLGLSGRGVFPLVNVFTDREAAVLMLEAPGIAPEDLKIESQGRTVQISGRREWKGPKDETGSFHRRERELGGFSRSLQLPAEYDPSRAEASYRHGVLRIRVPKSEQARPHSIEVKAA
jgi:HSP20 family protein